MVEKNPQLQKAYNELKAAQAQIIEKERLEHELQLATGIQVPIVPRALPQIFGTLTEMEAQAACDTLVKTLLAHRGHADRDDDVSLVAIHMAG